jgi:peroxiredoxin
MKRRWNANSLVLTVLLVILALVGIDVGRRMMAGPVEIKPPKVDTTPEFKVGDAAPAFSFPDQHSTTLKFADLVRRDTLLVFSCGCAQCREFQTYLGKMEKTLGPKAPDVVSVNTTDPMAADSWMRSTGLKQTMLYGPHKDGPAAPYHGAPCPRAFRVSADHKITYIGKSRADGIPVQFLGEDLAQQLGFAQGGVQTASAPAAPKMKWESEAAPPAAPKSPPVPGQDEHKHEGGAEHSAHESGLNTH